MVRIGHVWGGGEGFRYTKRWEGHRGKEHEWKSYTHTRGRTHAHMPIDRTGAFARTYVPYNQTRRGLLLYREFLLAIITDDTYMLQKKRK